MTWKADTTGITVTLNGKSYKTAPGARLMIGGRKVLPSRPWHARWARLRWWVGGWFR